MFWAGRGFLIAEANPIGVFHLMAGPGGEGQPSLGFSCLTRNKIVDSLTSIKLKELIRT